MVLNALEDTSAIFAHFAFNKEGSNVFLWRAELLIGSVLCYFSRLGRKKKDVGAIHHWSDRSSPAQHDRLGHQQSGVQGYNTRSQRAQEETPRLWVYPYFSCDRKLIYQSSEVKGIPIYSIRLVGSIITVWESADTGIYTYNGLRMLK